MFSHSVFASNRNFCRIPLGSLRVSSACFGLIAAAGWLILPLVSVTGQKMSTAMSTLLMRYFEVSLFVWMRASDMFLHAALAKCERRLACWLHPDWIALEWARASNASPEILRLLTPSVWPSLRPRAFCAGVELDMCARAPRRIDRRCISQLTPRSHDHHLFLQREVFAKFARQLGWIEERTRLAALGRRSRSQCCGGFGGPERRLGEAEGHLRVRRLLHFYSASGRGRDSSARCS